MKCVHYGLINFNFYIGTRLSLCPSPTPCRTPARRGPFRAPRPGHCLVTEDTVLRGAMSELYPQPQVEAADDPEEPPAAALG